MKVSNRRKSQYSGATADCTQSDQSPLSYDVGKATIKDEQQKDGSEKQSTSVIKSLLSQNSKLDIASMVDDSNACSEGSKKLHPSTCTSDELAQSKLHAWKEETTCNSFLNARPSDSILKTCIVEEAHDGLVVLDGKVKMSDIKTIYERSVRVDKQGYYDAQIMEAQEVRLVDSERRTKRLRDDAGPSGVYRGAVVKCPICGLAIPGDINAAEFNNQINLHVDSCIGFSKQH